MRKVMQAFVLANKSQMTNEEWKEARKQGIGGSDAGAILGLNPYCSALQVWATKRGLLPDKDDTEMMRLGRDLEYYVAERFEEEMANRNEPKKVKNCNFILRHPKYPWMLANVDRLIIGEQAGLECKIASSFNKTDFEGNNVPEQYYCQCQHYMAVTGATHWYLCILQLGKEPFIFRIERNENEIAALIELEKKFWEENVVKGIEPAVDGTEGARKVLTTLYPEGREDVEIDLSPFHRSMREIVEWKSQIKELETKIEKNTQSIQQYMQDASVGFSDAYKVTWRNQSRFTVDTAKLKKDHPELVAKYMRQSQSRQFLIKEI
jgi:putative phage-type endonuclease